MPTRNVSRRKLTARSWRNCWPNRLLAESAARLPVLVSGDAHWSVVRLDPNHIRVTLIDPGYLDPADRNAEIVLQHINGVRCIDILSGRQLPLKNGRIHVTIPMGTLRIVDIEHR